MKITHGAIILVTVPYDEKNPHMHSGTHMYLLCSNPMACEYSPVLQVLPFSARPRRLPVQPEVTASCFNKRCYALAEQLTLMPRHLLENGKYCGRLSDDSLRKVKEAIKMQLALD